MLKSKFARCGIIFPMLKLLLILALFFIGVNGVNAESRVNVKVNNDVSSSTSSTSSTNTNIRIEENGKITTYSSDKGENVEIKSENGVSEIKVNGQTVSENNSQENSSASPSIKPLVKPENNKQENENIFDFFGNLFRKIFLLF